MQPEISIDLYCDESGALSEVQQRFDGVDVEYASGLGGLEIVGTLIIPSAALCLQVISFVRELKREKHQSLQIKHIELRVGDKTVALPADVAPEQVAAAIAALE